MPEDFRGPRLKLYRAQSHIDDLHPLVRKFINRQDFRAVADFKLEPGSILWVASGRDDFPHDEFSPYIGDAVHNLRDALDLAVSVLMRNAGKSDANVQFPTADSFGGLQGAIARQAKRKPFPAQLIEVLETRIEPYKGGRGHWLRTLHKIAISDKHRLIVPTTFGVNMILVETEGMKLPLELYNGPKPIKDGTPLARILDVSDWPQIQAGQQAALTLTIAFDASSGPLRGEPIVDGLIRLKIATEEAIEALEETCF